MQRRCDEQTAIGDMGELLREGPLYRSWPEAELFVGHLVEHGERIVSRSAPAGLQALGEIRWASRGGAGPKQRERREREQRSAKHGEILAPWGRLATCGPLTKRPSPSFSTKLGY